MSEEPEPSEEEWFMVLLGPWGREDQPEADPELTGAAATLIRQLREHASTWSELGMSDDDTIGCYEQGRLRAGFEIADPEADVPIAAIRVEVGEHDWQAAWVDVADGLTATTMAAAQPKGEIVGGPISSAEATTEVAQILDWLRAQLHRPIERRSWHEATTETGTIWRFTDTGEALASSGSPCEPETADSVSTVRP